MKFATICSALLLGLSAHAATLNVTGTAAPDAGLYDYAYTFSITGSGLALDNLFLGSDDLSPLNVMLKLDGSNAVNWSWLGNNSPQNYLQFFSTNGGTISSADTFQVTFQSALAPAATHFAVGLDSATGVISNTVTGLTAPTVSSAATPEPTSTALFAVGILSLAGILRLNVPGVRRNELVALRGIEPLFKP